jgi:tetratricopeptide (TPR) repeat protein
MFTTLDLLRPAEVTFAPGVRNVLIVNNTVVQPYNVGHLNLSTGAEETVEFDSAALFTNASLKESLEDKEFFNSVRISQTNLNKTDNFEKISSLQKEDVKFLCNLYNADAVISLDHIQTLDEFGRYFVDYYIVNALDIKVISTWSVHYPDNTASTHKQFTDEFSWESENAQNIPTRYNALVDACILTGSNVAERLIPRWEKQDRYFYTPNHPKMQQAMDSVVTRNWKSAISLWEEAINSTRKNNTKFKAYNNISIAYEILGDINKALEFNQKAINLYPYLATILSSSSGNEIYEIINHNAFLKKRKEEIELIKKQLSEE